ncbi:YkgJ family cysteine cluster protein [Candidatus Woesearchaeota archaeon]|nr:YkgJ family cysteine cluster protein [Candidatus Woesearchaeota archaeon]
MQKINQAKLHKNTPLNEVLKLANACKCNACTVGCRHGSGVFADEEIEKLAGFMNIDAGVLKKEFLEEVEKFNTKKFRPRIKRKEGRPYGKCIFFDEQIGCKIHEAKPLECRIAMGCRDYGEDLILWFMLNHFVNKDDAESIRQFASYLKAGGKTLDGGKLEDLVPDKRRLKKILSLEIK